jgi:hypothetical protein
LDKELILKKQLVSIEGNYTNLDLAVDSKGVLHSIFDGFHFVLNNGEWEKCSKCNCTRILGCGEYIACAFISEPKEVGRDWRLNWYGFAGGGGGCLWPWPSIADKLIIARHSGAAWRNCIDIDHSITVDWTVIDNDTKLDISNYFSIAAEDSGALHVIYLRGRGDLFHDTSELSYVKIHPAGGLVDLPQDNILKKIYTTSGKRIGYISFDTDFDAAVDPVTGDVIVIARSINTYIDDYFSLIINKNNTGTLEVFLSGSCRGGVQVAAAGRGRFLALFSCDGGNLWLLEYFNNKWSKPIKLGRVYDSPSDTFKSIFSSGGENNRRYRFEILSDCNGNSMAIWINYDGRIVASLLELNK